MQQNEIRGRRDLLRDGGFHKPPVSLRDSDSIRLAIYRKLSMSITTESKACTVCEQVKPLSEFYKDKRALDGRQSGCKTCAIDYGKEYYRANRKAIRESRKGYDKAYKAANRERIRENRKAYDAEYRLKNPHLRWESGYRRRALRIGFVPYVESFTREELVARYGDKCFHCGGPFEQLDHYPVPVADNGVRTLDNCKPSCADCNAFQGTKYASRRNN